MELVSNQNGYTDDFHGIDATVNNQGPKPWAAGDPTYGSGIYPAPSLGTMVAGVIGAVGNNAMYTAGVCWRVQIMPIKANIDVNFPTDFVIEGMDYAIENGADIINLSFAGSGDDTRSLREIYTKARNRGVIVVAGLGNNAVDNDLRDNVCRYYPASFELDNIVSVGASTANDALWWVSPTEGSNYGQTTCDLMAPGENILTTDISGGYTTVSGTSLAAPHVSGVLALLKAQFPQDNYHGLINRLLSGSDPVAAFAGKCATGGRLNAYAALSSTAPTLLSELTFDETVLNRDRANGRFTMKIVGPPGESVYVEGSDSLLSSFALSPTSGDYDHLSGRQILAGTSIPSQGWLLYTNTTATTTARFYRCREHLPLGGKSTDPQHVSCNTVGYVDRSVPAGWSMLSTPLEGLSICIPALFAGVPVGFKVDTWDEYGQQWIENVHQGNGVWSGPDCLTVRQTPRFGCFVYNPQSTNLTVTFTGRVLQHYFEDSLPAAMAIRSAYVPDTGGITTHLRFPTVDGLTVYLFKNGGYEIYDYSFGVWSSSEPKVGVGDAFWTHQPANVVWKQYHQTWINGDRK
jgi:hypothetical protein